MSGEPESDVELDDMPSAQHKWREEAPIWIKDQLPSFCTRISKRVHRAIPAHVGDWRQALSNGATGVMAATGSDPFELRLGETAHSWCMQSAKSITNVVINLNMHSEVSQEDFTGVFAALREEVRMSLKRNRADEEVKEEESCRTCRKKRQKKKKKNPEQGGFN
jgi:hypothetical protein